MYDAFQSSLSTIMCSDHFLFGNLSHAPHTRFSSSWIQDLKFILKDRFAWLNANSNRCFENEKAATKGAKHS
jgi:hypothetical protein